MRTLNFTGTRTVTFQFPFEDDTGLSVRSAHFDVVADVFGGEKKSHNSPGFPFDVELLSVKYDGADAHYSGLEDDIIQAAIDAAKEDA